MEGVLAAVWALALPPQCPPLPPLLHITDSVLHHSTFPEDTPPLSLSLSVVQPSSFLMSHVTNLSRLPPLPGDQSHPHRGTLYAHTEHTAALARSRHHRRSQCSGRERERGGKQARGRGREESGRAPERRSRGRGKHSTSRRRGRRRRGQQGGGGGGSP